MTATLSDVLEGRAPWTVIEGDCLAILPTMPAKCVAHVVADPPYDEHTHTHARSLKDGGRDIPIDFAPLDNFTHVREELRVAQRWVLNFCALEQLGEYKRAAGDAWVRAGVWHRTDGTPQISGDRPAQGAEGIAIAHQARPMRWNGGGERGCWSFGVERDPAVRDSHPTPKPLPLMQRLIELFTDPGDLVLDPFCGSGSTGLACVLLGRRFIGIDLDPDHVATSIARIRGWGVTSARAGQLSLLG